jgi:hypothetical protein
LRKLLKKLPLLLALTSIVHGDYHPIEVLHGGTIRGLVKYPTETRPRAMFGTRGDANCPAGIPQEQLIVKQESRGIKNVLIVLDIKEGKPLKPMSAHLDNKNCRFIPRIQWAPKDTSLVVTNSDPTVHNVRALRHDVATFSVTIDPKGPPAQRPLVETGLYKINCDRHLWMRAWIYVTEQPYVAITDGEGRFELKDVPAGSYDLMAWHEGWTESGTEHTGQPRFIPMQEILKVTARKDEVTDVLLDDLQPTFIHGK